MLTFYYFDFSPVFSFLPLYLSFHLDSLYRHPDFHIFCISTQIPRILSLIPHTHNPIMSFTDSLLSL